MFGMVSTVFNGAVQTATNAYREADATAAMIQGAQIEHQERENALAGMRVNLSNNQLRRMNDSQRTLGGIG